MNSTRSFGTMTVTRLFHSSIPTPRTTNQVVRSFLETAEGYAHRWIDTRKGILLLQMVPYTTDTGSIYIFDRERDLWYRLSFQSVDDTFTAETFEQAFAVYRLAAYVGQPGLLLALVEQDEKVVEVNSSRRSESFSADLSIDLFRERVSQSLPIAA